VKSDIRIWCIGACKKCGNSIHQHFHHTTGVVFCYGAFERDDVTGLCKWCGKDPHAHARVSGLSWRNTGTHQPKEKRVRALTKPANLALSKALSGKQKTLTVCFTPKEWKAFQVKDLDADDVIKAGDYFYVPEDNIGIGMPGGHGEQSAKQPLLEGKEEALQTQQIVQSDDSSKACFFSCFGPIKSRPKGLPDHAHPLTRPETEMRV